MSDMVIGRESTFADVCVEINETVRRVDAVTQRTMLLEATVAALKGPVPVVPAPAPAPAPAPPVPVPAGGVVLPVLPDSLATLLSVTTDMASVDVGSNTILRISGAGRVGVVIIRPGSSRILIDGGRVGRIAWEPPATAEQRTSDVTISKVRISSGAEYAMKVYGDRVRVVDCHVSTTTQYAAWVGSETPVRDITFEGCVLQSTVGGQPTLRCTDVIRLLVKDCTIESVNRHCLRVHGASSDVQLLNVRLRGAGNGLAIGALGPQVPASVVGVLMDRVSIAVGGEDVLNLARDGSLRGLRIANATLTPNATVAPDKWDLVKEYRDAPGAGWDVSGLTWAVAAVSPTP